MTQRLNATLNVKVTPAKGSPILLKGEMANNSMLVVYPQKNAEGIPSFYRFTQSNGVWKNIDYGFTAEILS